MSKAKKGSHRTEAGPIKGTIQTIGGLCVIGGGITAYNSHLGAGVVMMGVGAGLIGLASLIPDKNHVTW